MFSLAGADGLDRLPIVHGDEMWNAAPAWKLASRGAYGSGLFTGYHGAEGATYQFMPMLQLLLGAQFRLFGLGLRQLRMFSVGMGSPVLVLAWAIGHRVGGQRRVCARDHPGRSGAASPKSTADALRRRFRNSKTRPAARSWDVSVARRNSSDPNGTDLAVASIEGDSTTSPGGQVMARLNPDPYDQTIFALVNHVTGVLDSPDQVRSALVTLERAGFAGNDIDLFTGEEGARQLDLSGSVHSGMLRLARRLETSIGDEGPVHGRIERELRGGRTLVSVNLSGGKHSKTLVMKLLTSCLAREVHHWGRWSFEDAH